MCVWLYVEKRINRLAGNVQYLVLFPFALASDFDVELLLYIFKWNWLLLVVIVIIILAELLGHKVR